MLRGAAEKEILTRRQEKENCCVEEAGEKTLLLGSRRKNFKKIISLGRRLSQQWKVPVAVGAKNFAENPLTC